VTSELLPAYLRHATVAATFARVHGHAAHAGQHLRETELRDGLDRNSGDGHGIELLVPQ
jgi:hypothetical protein